jgi:hypothetical protein
MSYPKATNQGNAKQATIIVPRQIAIHKGAVAKVKGREGTESDRERHQHQDLIAG